MTSPVWSPILFKIKRSKVKVGVSCCFLCTVLFVQFIQKLPFYWYAITRWMSLLYTWKLYSRYNPHNELHPRNEFVVELQTNSDLQGKRREVALVPRWSRGASTPLTMIRRKPLFCSDAAVSKWDHWTLSSTGFVWSWGLITRKSYDYLTTW